MEITGTLKRTMSVDWHDRPGLGEREEREGSREYRHGQIYWKGSREMSQKNIFLEERNIMFIYRWEWPKRENFMIQGGRGSCWASPWVDDRRGAQCEAAGLKQKPGTCIYTNREAEEKHNAGGRRAAIVIYCTFIARPTLCHCRGYMDPREGQSSL